MSDSVDLAARVAALSPHHRELLERRLQRRGSERAEEPIAIVGMACRFPGAEDPGALLELLRRGEDAIADVPNGRWNAHELYDADPDAPGKMASRWGGFLSQVDAFDAGFFGISPGEALHMDPQQRLLLEVGWEALEDAGIPPSTLAGSDAGVFVGIMNADYGQTRYGSLDTIDAYAGSGNAYGMTANRLSYQWDLRGPSLAIDTACSSSLVAVHLACGSLRGGETSLALVGGVNVLLWPGHTVYFTKAGLIAADGRCKTFDARADGIVRGEGAGMVVLKKLSDARRDGDRVWAVVRGSAVNQDGRSNGITAPNPAAQQAVLRAAYQSAGVSPGDVGYVEAHGTGTALGDPIEANALGSVLAEGRSGGVRCAVGSIKTNFGHLEAAAGIAGLIKTVLTVSRGEIFPHLHFRDPNPEISFDELPLRVPTSLEPWPEGAPRVAGVSSFGFGGTNAHVVVEAGSAERMGEPTARSRQVLTLSARSPEALRTLAARYSAALQGMRSAGAPGEPDLADVCATANTGRHRFQHRVGALGRTADEVGQRLGRFARGERADGVVEGVTTSPPRVAFLFTGQGSQYEGMGRELYDSQSTFRDALDECEGILRDHLAVPLLSVMYPGPGATPGLIHQTAYSQPALLALEYALAKLWRSWGVDASAVLGHSVGEYAAAWAAGVISLEDGLRVVAERGRLMQELPPGGAMVSARVSEERARALLEGFEDRLSVAAVNGPASVVLSGASEALDEVEERLADQGIETRRLEVSHAFHSPLVEPALAGLEDALKRVALAPPRVDLVSNVTGAPASSELVSPGYWRRHAREPVRFAAGIEALLGQGCEVFVEIGPKPTLLGMAAAVADRDSALGLPSLRKGFDDWEPLLASLGALYVRGVPVDWGAFHGPSRTVSLPTYPFERKRYWLPATAPGRVEPALLRPRRLHSPALAEDVWETAYDSRAPLLRDHRLLGEVVVAGGAHLSLALTAAADLDIDAPSVEELAFLQPLALADDETRVVQLVRDRETGAVEIHSRPAEGEARWMLHATAKVTSAAIGASPETRSSPDAPPMSDLAEVRARCTEELAPELLAEESGGSALYLGPSMQWLGPVVRRHGEAVAPLRPPLDGPTDAAVHAGLLDSCFRLLSAALHPEERGELRVPFRVARCRLRRPVSGELWGHAVLHAATNGTPTAQGAVRGDVHVVDHLGRVVLEMEGVELRRARNGIAADWLHEVAWRPARLPGAPVAPAPGRWLIFVDEEGLGEALARELRRAGATTVEVFPGGAFEAGEDGRAVVRTDSLEDVSRLLDSVMGDGGGRRGVVYLWCLADGPPGAGRSGLRNLLHVAQALPSGVPSGGGAPELWVVTRGAQGAPPAGSDVSVGQAPAWGLAGVLGSERPWQRTVCVDLDPHGLPDDARRDFEAERLAAELSSPDGEQRIVHRASERRVARLQRRDVEVAPDGPDGPPVRSDASYLVTGGLGSLGLQVARWLTARGAGTLVLVGRTAPSDRALDEIAALEARGARVLVRQVDVSRSEEVAELVAWIASDATPLRGVVHTAGVVDDGLIPFQDWERFQRVLAPKVDGSWNLHRHTADMDLELFVLFSSTAPLLSPPGQSAYAAANAFLDALAHHRRGCGLPALSINWGPWSGGGMAAEMDDEVRRRWRAAGISLIEPEVGLRLMETMLGSGCAQMGVFPIEWTRYSSALPSGVTPPLLLDLLAGGAATAAPAPPDADASSAEPRAVTAHLDEAVAEDRRVALVELIRGEARRILHLAADATIRESESLFELGMDSLMALEMRNGLQSAVGRPLAGTLVFDYPTVADIATVLAGEADGGGEATRATAGEV